MISPEEALRLILENAARLPGESVPLGDCVDRVLAEDVYSTEDLPPFDNSAMDGFAVRFQDCALASPQAPVFLAVRETVRAGELSRLEIRPGEAVKIMTGAPIPRGADAVVMREMTRSQDGGVSILQAPESGDHIRRHGEDIRPGALLLTKGVKIRPYEIALLAAQGISRVSAVMEPRVSILATGDELVDVAEHITPGKIRNSNGPALAAALSRWRAGARSLGIVRDEPAQMRATLRHALEGADVLLVSGGVSVGDFDYTKALLEELGLKVIFWKAAIKPGKPLLFGLWDGRLVFGLPGNPVSAMVCLEEFVRPALETLQGHAPAHPRYHLKGRALNDYPKPKDRQQYLFCQVDQGDDGYGLRIIRPQGSAMLGMACRANALAVSPIGVSRIEEGDVLAFRWLK